IKSQREKASRLLDFFIDRLNAVPVSPVEKAACAAEFPEIEIEFVGGPCCGAVVQIPEWLADRGSVEFLAPTPIRQCDFCIEEYRRREPGSRFFDFVGITSYWSLPTGERRRKEARR